MGMAVQLDELKRRHGLFLLDKPVGVTSFGLLEDLKYSLAREIGVPVKQIPKMGHGGTLDPFATGLLVVCFNDGVKLSRYYLDSAKTYVATVRFGETTVSGDFTNDVTERTEHLPASREEIQAAADLFRSTPYDQIPPMHSAKKVGGQTLYKLARQGIDIERAAKRCEVRSLEVLSYDRETRTAVIRTEVTAGTYIRTLAQDLARKMGSLAALSDLQRTASGKFSLDDATSLRDLLTFRGFVPMNEALPHFRHVPINAEDARALREGRQGGLTEMLQRAGITPVVPPTLDSSLPARDHVNDSTTGTPPARVALYEGSVLLGIATLGETGWGIERIFSRN